MNKILAKNSCPFSQLAQNALDVYYNVPGRVQMFLSHVGEDTRQPIEYKTFLRLFHASDYSIEHKNEILKQQTLCYNVGGAAESARTNLIIYTLDFQGMVTRWGCYYKGEEPRKVGPIGVFQDIIPVLQRRGFEFIPPEL